MDLSSVHRHTNRAIQTWIAKRVCVVQLAGGDRADPAGLYTALGDEVARLNKDLQIRGVVIVAAGSQFRSVSQGSSLQFGLIQNQFEAISGISKPTVAVINNSTDVIGLEVALACDVRICSQDARFPAGFCKPTAPYCSPAISAALSRIVGPGWARLMAFSDRFISADRALRIGLVDEVVGANRLIERAVQVASRLRAEREIVKGRMN